MTNYVEAFGAWKQQQGDGDWTESRANYPETDARCITQGTVTRDGAVVTPDQAALDSAWAAHLSDPDTIEETGVKTARQSTLSTANKARNHAAKIAICFDAVVTAEAQLENADATFLRIVAALNDPSITNGYRTAVMTAFVANGGTSFSLTGDVTLVLLPTRQAFNSFAKSFFTRWVFMVSLFG